MLIIWFVKQVTSLPLLVKINRYDSIELSHSSQVKNGKKIKIYGKKGKINVIYSFLRLVESGILLLLLQFYTSTQTGSFSMAFSMCGLIRLNVFIFLFFGFFRKKTPNLSLLFQTPHFNNFGLL